MQQISRDELKSMLLVNGMQLVEVLPPQAFRTFHLPGAINVPLDDEFDQQIQQAIDDKSKRIVVYCLDTECQASAKAVERMENLGYQHVADYEAGKEDWKAAGLPIEY